MYVVISETFGIRVASALKTTSALCDLRAAVASAVYADVYEALQAAAGGRNFADVYAYYSLVCAAALLTPEDRKAAAVRIAADPQFETVFQRNEAGFLAMAEVFSRRFEHDGWRAVQRAEALKGLTSALSKLASERHRAPSVHHVSPSPELRSAGFAPFIDRLVFGIAPTVVDDVRPVEVRAVSTPVSLIEGEQLSTLGRAVADWIDGLNCASSDHSGQSRAEIGGVLASSGVAV